MGRDKDVVDDLELTLSHLTRVTYPEARLLTVITREQLSALAKVTPFDRLDVTDRRKSK